MTLTEYAVMCYVNSFQTNISLAFVTQTGHLDRVTSTCVDVLRTECLQCQPSNTIELKRRIHIESEAIP
jgi:hypothetical protein